MTTRKQASSHHGRERVSGGDMTARSWSSGSRTPVTRHMRYYVTITAARLRTDPCPPSWPGGQATTLADAVRIAKHEARHVRDSLNRTEVRWQVRDFNNSIHRDGVI